MRLDEQWTTASNIPPGVFYGLFRKGLPRTSGCLLRSRFDCGTRWRRPRSGRKLIDPLTAGQVIRYRCYCEKAVSLGFPAPTDSKTTPPVGVVLATSSLPARVQRKVVEFVPLGRDDDDILTDERDGGLKAAEECRPVYARGRAFAVQPFASACVSIEVASRAPPDWRRRSRSFSPDELKRIAAESTAGGMPKGFENRDAFAKAIGHRIEQAFPTVVFGVAWLLGTFPPNVMCSPFCAPTPGFYLLHYADRYCS